MLRARGYGRVLDLGPVEEGGQYFEGTGVLVLDRVNGVAYVALSERACGDMAADWAHQLGYEVCALHTFLPLLFLLKH